MSITQEQIINVTKKLWKLKPKNEWKMVDDIKSIVSYIDLLNEVDTTWITPTVSPITQKTSLKVDIEKRDIKPKELLDCSPCKIVANQIVISDIMK